MVARINLLGINKPDCPSNEDGCCNELTHQFAITVACTSPPRPKFVHFYNLCGECVEVLRTHDGKCCDDQEAPLLCNGKPVVLSQANPEIILTLPGRYVFRTLSSEPFDFDEVAVEVSAIDIEFARLRLEQHSACCCNERV